MGDSVENILKEREAKIAAIREALAIYPDLFFEGEYCWSDSVKSEDCNEIVCIKGEYGLKLVPARMFENIGVLRHRFYDETAEFWFSKLKKKDPDLFARVLKSVAGDR